jgi:hypothetical protein
MNHDQHLIRAKKQGPQHVQSTTSSEEKRREQSLEDMKLSAYAAKFIGFEKYVLLQTCMPVCTH